MPVLEYIFLLQIFYYHNSNKNVKKFYFLTLHVAIFILCAVLIYFALNIKNSLSYIEWGSIFLWSFESFPQISLNFKLSSVAALSKTGQLITFFGKSCDITSNYLLIIPYQYRFLGFFSTTNAYIGVIQVLFYFENEVITNGNEKLPLQTKKNEIKMNKKLILMLSVFVILCCGGTAFGFVHRVANLFISLPVLICEYFFVLMIYAFSKWERLKNSKKEGKFIPITE